ncbi:MAG TPA: P63C domain-containing protein [Oligoflexus sp.]|uniref:P63C domain-containing protein n=1 Tax=Oligoflexus sp. TaxID=1971216 RepID=UPI002D408C29|nr:P63C domain-containing protein [Oligoflexus sp.]HYX32598.1 P63C domain-containing protein [Oligoflexus sp.]
MKVVLKEADAKHIPRATHGSPDSPLIIGEVKLPCYVLEDGTRLITQEAMLSALGRSKNIRGKRSDMPEVSHDKTPSFLVPLNLKPFISEDFSRTTKPITFRTKAGRVALGYRAEVLPELCDVYLKARDADALHPSQLHIAKACELLIRGLAKVGVIAMVDEATGYQKDRSDTALKEILDAFIAKELQPYVTKFPPEFYEHIFRLHHLPYDKSSAKRPQFFGKITRDIIYRRMAPGVWEEIRTKVARNEEGRPTQHMHRYLTSDFGDPRLQRLIEKVITIMEVSRSWDEFMRTLNKLLPVYDESGFANPVVQDKFPKLIYMRTLGLEDQPIF